MRRFLIVFACMLLALSVQAKQRRRTCLFHIALTYALPPGTISDVRVVAVGSTKIVKVIGYSWNVQPNYPNAVVLVPPSTGPQHLSMITVEVDASSATGAQKIDIAWRGGKPRKIMCHQVLDVSCGRSGGVPVDKEIDHITVAKTAVAAPAGTPVDCRLASAAVVEEGPVEDAERDGDCDPSFEIKDLGCNTYQFQNTTEYDVIGVPPQYQWTVAREDDAGGDDVLIPLPNATAEHQTLTFPGPGTYIVSLEASGLACGNDSEEVAEEILIPDLAANFAFTHLPTQAFAIQLQNQSSSEAQSYSWDFNDNTAPSTAPNPSHAFPAPGPYDVCLTATSASGCQSQSCKQVHISADCEADFTSSYRACLTPSGVNGYDVDFTNTSAATGSGADYEWDFGDGSQTTWTGTTITHHYFTEGTYTVKLKMIGSTCSTQKTVTLHMCTADFRWQVCKDGEVFVSTSDPGPVWDFVGGKPPDGTGAESKTKYKQPGVHPITLTTEDAAHCKCEKIHEVTTENLCCRKNQHSGGTETFSYDGRTYRVRLRFAIHNILGIHWVRVKMVVKRKQGNAWKKYKADSLSIQWGGDVYLQDGKCKCGIQASASDSVGPVSAKKVKKRTPISNRFWARKQSLTATFKVKIDANHTEESWTRELSKPCP